MKMRRDCRCVDGGLSTSNRDWVGLDGSERAVAFEGGGIDGSRRRKSRRSVIVDQYVLTPTWVAVES